eukprot:scaffold66476_cov39-Cyclotella_meneghiniana.AAC.2
MDFTSSGTRFTFHPPYFKWYQGQGLLPEIYPTPDTRSDRVYPTTYPTSPVPGARYPNTYLSTHSKLGYHTWVARHFSKWGICSPNVEIPEYLPEHGLGHRAIPGYLPEESNYSGSKP